MNTSELKVGDYVVALVAESILETLTTARKQIARFAEALEARA